MPIDHEDEGNVAEDLATGFACQECGIYFRAKHGHPVLCRRCYENAVAKGKKVRHADRAYLPEA